MTTPRIYHHLGHQRLRDWLHVEIEERDGNKHVTFVSSIHIGNRFPVRWSYSTDWSDEEILNDRQLYVLCHDKFGPDFYVGSMRI